MSTDNYQTRLHTMCKMYAENGLPLPKHVDYTFVDIHKVRSCVQGDLLAFASAFCGVRGDGKFDALRKKVTEIILLRAEASFQKVDTDFHLYLNGHFWNRFLKAVEVEYDYKQLSSMDDNCSPKTVDPVA